LSKIDLIKSNALKVKPADEAGLGFGRIFTDYMFSMDYSPAAGWHEPRVEPYHALSLDPSTLVLHYGQAIFEGLKCYRRSDGGLQLFRARDNFTRFNRSAERMSIPQFDESIAMDGLEALLSADGDWTPRSEGASLYIRPTIIATDHMVGVRASETYLFFIILSPSGSYYPGGLAPVGIFVEDKYVRAARGGVGFAKTAANYAASIKAGEIAKQRGYAQVLWLDSVEKRYIEEVGSMNVMFVINDVLVTPELTDSILPGITRDSVLKLAAANGVEVEERRISINEVMDAAASGLLREAFGTGTAAVISPIGELCYGYVKLIINNGEIGPLARMMYDTLTGIQYCRLPDPFGWIQKLA
jgi:branched-chain amino acid aminotransferase